MRDLIRLKKGMVVLLLTTVFVVGGQLFINQFVYGTLSIGQILLFLIVPAGLIFLLNAIHKRWIKIPLIFFVSLIIFLNFLMLILLFAKLLPPTYKCETNKMGYTCYRVASGFWTKEEYKCHQKNGHFSVSGGGFGQPASIHCYTKPYADAGKTCTDSNQCEGKFCVIDNAPLTSTPYDGLATIPCEQINKCAGQCLDFPKLKYLGYPFLYLKDGKVNRYFWAVE